MATDFFVDDDVDIDVALQLDAGFLEELHRQDMAGHPAFHVARTTAVDAAVLYRRRPGVVAPAFAVADRDDVGVAVEQKRMPAALALARADDVGPTLIAALDRPIAGVLLERLPIGLPHVDIETDAVHVVGYKSLNGRLVAGDARNRHHLAQELDRLILVPVDCVEDGLPAFAAHSPNSMLR